MRCKCGYNSFEYNLKCPKCKKDTSAIRKLLNLSLPHPGPTDFFAIAANRSFSSAPVMGMEPGASHDIPAYEQNIGEIFPIDATEQMASSDAEPEASTIYPMEVGFNPDEPASSEQAAPQMPAFAADTARAAADDGEIEIEIDDIDAAQPMMPPQANAFIANPAMTTIPPQQQGFPAHPQNAMAQQDAFANPAMTIMPQQGAFANPAMTGLPQQGAFANPAMTGMPQQGAFANPAMTGMPQVEEQIAQVTPEFDEIVPVVPQMPNQDVLVNPTMAQHNDMMTQIKSTLEATGDISADAAVVNMLNDDLDSMDDFELPPLDELSNAMTAPAAPYNSINVPEVVVEPMNIEVQPQVAETLLTAEALPGPNAQAAVKPNAGATEGALGDLSSLVGDLDLDDLDNM